MRHTDDPVGDTPRRKSSVAAGAVSVAFQPTYVLIAVVGSVIDGRAVFCLLFDISAHFVSSGIAIVAHVNVTYIAFRFSHLT